MIGRVEKMDKDLALVDVPDSRLSRAKFLLSQSRDVFIRHNDEGGEWMWSIEASIDRAFWFNAFLTRDEAVQWAANAGLNIAGIENGRDS
jgi:hypothetical protein